jgi:chaperonin GroEL
VTILLGAGSEVEFKEKRDKLVDGMNALLMARRGGVLPGGGVALLRLCPLVDLLGLEQPLADMLRRALQAPFLRLCRGLSPALRRQAMEAEFSQGLDLRTGEFCDLLDRGVIEGSETVIANLRTALRAAYSMLSTQVVLTRLDRHEAPSYREFKGKYGL